MTTTTTDEQIVYERERVLLNLSRIFETDKREHGYFKWYARHLPDKCNTLLEIGCYKGASLKVWNVMFGRDCDIHTIDLFAGDEKGLMSVRECRRNEFIPHKGDQSDMRLLASLPDQYFEIVIDDGSHRSDHQLISFKHLFVNNLLPSGLYVIEDLHCCKDPFWWGSPQIIKDVKDTALGMVRRYLQDRQIVNPYFNEGEKLVFQNTVANIELHDDKIAFIWKK